MPRELMRLAAMQDIIQDLRQQVDSLKTQVGGMLDEAEAKDRLVTSLKQQLDARDRQVQDLSKELQQTQGQLTDATSALKAKDALLQEQEQALKGQEEQLAERDAELAALNARQAAAQKLHRSGSAASTSHRSVPGCPLWLCISACTPCSCAGDSLTVDCIAHRAAYLSLLNGPVCAILALSTYDQLLGCSALWWGRITRLVKLEQEDAMLIRRTTGFLLQTDVNVKPLLVTATAVRKIVRVWHSDSSASLLHTMQRFFAVLQCWGPGV